MLRVFKKGIACLHKMAQCGCPPQPITMELRTTTPPARDFVMVCATLLAHGAPYMRQTLTCVDDKIERRAMLALGLVRPVAAGALGGGKGLLLRSSYLIMPDGVVLNATGHCIGITASLKGRAHA